MAFVFTMPVQAREAPIPKDQDKFTAYMAKRFTEAEPAAKISVKGPLALNIERGANDTQTIFLTNVWDFCGRERRQCRKSVDDFIQKMSAIQRQSHTDPTMQNIRVVIRGSAYVRDLEEMGRKNPEHAPIVRPLGGDLWEVCVVDQPNGISQLQKGALSKLGLTEEQAVAAGEKNVAAALPPLEKDTRTVPKMGLTFAAGDFYETSRIALHTSWADLAKRYGGHLVVAAPTSDFLIYGNGTEKHDRLLLSAFAHTIVEKANRPISVTLLQWTQTGWEVVTP